MKIMKYVGKTKQKTMLFDGKIVHPKQINTGRITTQIDTSFQNRFSIYLCMYYYWLIWYHQEYEYVCYVPAQITKQMSAVVRNRQSTKCILSSLRATVSKTKL